jgi:hypothetical protein
MYTANSKAAGRTRARGAILIAAILCALGASPASAGAAACFSSPSGCGYPDATNTGVPAGTQLTASGSRTLSTNGQVLDGVDLTGTVTIAADNVTIQNSRLHLAKGGSGTAVVKLNSGADNFTIKDSEVYGGSGPNDAIESAVWNLSNNTGATAIRSYFHACSECWHGSGTFRDTYILVDAGYPGSHDEDIYVCNGVLDIDHSTMFNYNDQTSTVFGDTYCGGSNDITITNSLLAGGGQMLTLQAHSTSRVGTTRITGNHFSRCLGSPYTANNGNWYCTGGSDSHGLFPYGGSYMVATEYYTGTGQIWENNVWDDNLQPVCPNGNSGCGTTQPPADNPATAVWTAPSGAVAGTAVTLDGTASTGDAPLTCTWSFENADGSSVLDTRSGCKISYTFQQAGTQYVKLTVKDVDGDTNSSKKSFSVSSPSEPPPPDAPAAAVWNAPPEALVGVPIALDGTDSTGDAPVSCTWSFENADGSTVWETHPGCAIDFTFELIGSKYVKLTVTDGDGDVDSNKQSFDVSSVSSPPPPDIPADAVWTAPSGAVAGTAVTLDGTASTGDAPLTCRWSFENADGSSVLDTRTGCRISYTFAQSGTKYVRLTVTDVDGDTDSSRQSFAVAPVPPPDLPADAVWTAPSGAVAGTAVTLDGTASTGDAPLTCTWSFENADGSSVYDTRSGCTISNTFQQAGTQYVKLTVRDGDGDVDSNKQSFDVAAPPTKSHGRGENGGGNNGKGKPAKALWTAPRDTRVGQAVTLDASASEGEAPLACAWSVENRSGDAVQQPRYGCTINLRFRRAGVRYVELAVQGSDGAADSLEQVVRVKRRARNARPRHRGRHGKRRKHHRHHKHGGKVRRQRSLLA